MFKQRRIRRLRGRGWLALAVVVGIVGAPQSALAEPPSNDDFNNATPIESLPFAVSQDTSEATEAIDDPSCRYTSERSVWFRYTPEDDALLEASVDGSNYPTTLSAYTGMRGLLSRQGCTIDPKLKVDIDGDETVYFMVTRFRGRGYDDDSDAGSLLNFALDVAPPPLEATMRVTPTGLRHRPSGNAVLRGTLDCSREAEFSFSGEVKQKVSSNQVVEGSFRRTLKCDGQDTKLWTAWVEPYRGSFRNGFTSVETSLRNDYEEVDISKERTVKLSTCTIIGTTKDDRLEGFPRDDIICGLAGNDRIISKGGNDRLVGGPGKDRLDSGDGNDLLIGGPGIGVNRMNGGGGDDTCKKETARDAVTECERVK